MPTNSANDRKNTRARQSRSPLIEPRAPIRLRIYQRSYNLISVTAIRHIFSHTRSIQLNRQAGDYVVRICIS